MQKTMKFIYTIVEIAREALVTVCFSARPKTTAANSFRQMESHLFGLMVVMSMRNFYQQTDSI
jgi:hypothetical protein